LLIFSLLPLTSFLSLEFDSEIYSAKNNAHASIGFYSQTIAFPNVSSDILKNLKSPNSPNGNCRILAFFYKSDTQTRGMLPSEFEGFSIGGKPFYSHYSSSRLCADVSLLWPLAGDVTCNVNRIALSAYPLGFLSFIAVRIMDVENVSWDSINNLDYQTGLSEYTWYRQSETAIQPRWQSLSPAGETQDVDESSY
jgi:hypothetical protein